MDKDLEQQLVYMNMFFNMQLLSRGPSAWDFSGRAVYPTNINVGGRFYGGDEIQNIAIQAKRRGQYAAAVGGYFHLFGACFKQYGKIPIEALRGYIKVLFVINEYWTAFGLLATLLADMQKSRGIDYQTASLLQTDFNTLMDESIAYIDRGQYYSRLHILTAGYSGADNYEFVQTQAEIRTQLSLIRDKVREIYGK